MKNRLPYILPPALLIAGVLGAVLLVKLKPEPPQRPRVSNAPLVRVESVAVGPYQVRIASQGSVTPRTETNLVAEVAGRVVRVSPAFAAGGAFAKGDVLLWIDDRDYEIAVVRADAQVAQARVALEQEEAQAAIAREEWGELGRGDPTPLASRELQLAQARAALASAEAWLHKAKLDRERTAVRALYDGSVRQKLADIGQFVSPGQVIGRIFATDYAEIRLPIPDEDLAFLALGDDPAVVLRARYGGAEREWKGTIVRKEAEIDPVTRMVTLVARVGRQENELPFGLFVDAEIEGRDLASAAVLPRAAMRGDGRVYVVEEETLRFREVQVARRESDRVVVGSGLATGDLVILSRLTAATDGMKVRTADQAGGDV